MTAGDGWYVYGVVPAAEASPALFADVAGVSGSPVRLVDGGALAAIASEVPLAEFGEEAITTKLRDPEWLEGRVRAHDAVLEAALGLVPVVPFRFGAIYRGENHVRELLSDDEKFAEALERVRGRLEFGVKAFLMTPDAEAPPAANEGSSTAGRRYLEAKQQARRLAEEQDAQKARWADASHQRLAAVSEAATANPPQPREISGRNAEMFLNGAYLVAAERDAEFRGVLTELGDEFGANGVAYELTGPWPAYNFVERPA